MLPDNTTLTEENLTEETRDMIINDINEYLAETYGYCNNGYGYEINIEVNHIDWDVED